MHDKVSVCLFIGLLLALLSWHGEAISVRRTKSNDLNRNNVDRDHNDIVDSNNEQNEEKEGEVLERGRRTSQFYNNSYAEEHHCSITHIFNDLKQECVKGSEFDEDCDSDFDCYTGLCDIDTKKCSCRLRSDCIGCTSNDAICIRFEQVDLSGVENLAVKTINVEKISSSQTATGTKSEDEHQNIELFSKGHYGKQSGYESNYRKSQFEPLAPVFVQANLKTSKLDGVYKVDIYGERASLIGGQLFVEDNWITTISDNHILKKNNKNSDDIASVQLWPRDTSEKTPCSIIARSVNETTKYKTWVYNVTGEMDLDFHIPRGIALEFNGITEESTVNFIDDVYIDGRVSFNRISVHFKLESSMNISSSGSVMFDNCGIVVDEIRCPTGFKYVRNNNHDNYDIDNGNDDGVCLALTDVRHSIVDAEEECLQHSARGFLPKYSEIPTDFFDRKVSYDVLPEGVSAWFASEHAQTCTMINSARKGVTRRSYKNNKNTRSSTHPCAGMKYSICAAQPKNFIEGIYSVYYSTLIVQSYEELVMRLADPSTLPIQLGSLAIIAGNENKYNESESIYNESESIRAVSDSQAIAVRIEMTLEEGDQSDILVAVDTFDSVSEAVPHGWNLHKHSVAPSKIQLHAKNPVCISSIEVLLRNATGIDHKAITIPADKFLNCLHLNVCSQDNEHECARSLMFFDNNRKCAILNPTNPKYPRDLSIDLKKGLCKQLTTWNHKNLGEAFVLEVHETGLNHRTDPFFFQDATIEVHKYRFDVSDHMSQTERRIKEGENNLIKRDIFESHLLPTLFEIEGGNGGRLMNFRITRYNQTIADVDFRSLLSCKNLCSKLVNDNGLLFSNKNGASIALVSPFEIGCQQICEVETKNITGLGDYDGRTTCSSPEMTEIRSINELTRELESISLDNSTYRSLQFFVPSSGLSMLGKITVPANRVLKISTNKDDIDISGSDVEIESADFVVPSGAELYIDGITLSGGAKINVMRGGFVELSNCRFSQMVPLRSQELSLLNHGIASLAVVYVDGNTILQNSLGGVMDLRYVEFAASSQLQAHTGVSGSTSASNLKLHENFELDDSIVFPNTNLSYSVVDDFTNNDSSCESDNNFDEKILSLDTNGCKHECNNELFCSGFFSYHDYEKGSLCRLCLGEVDQCCFDDETSDGSYWKAESNFKYTKVEECMADSRPFMITSEIKSIEKCKAICDSYRECEGFILLPSQKSCQLIADLDFNEECSEKESVYVAYKNSDHGSFVSVNGELVASGDQDEIAKHEGKRAEECSIICVKTLYCVSFIINDSNDCILYKSSEYQWSQNNNGLHIYVAEIFPKKRYMLYPNHTPITEPMSAYSVKTRNRCKNLCNLDFFCASLSYSPYTFHNESNCHLFNEKVVVDEDAKQKETMLLEVQKKFETGELHVVYMHDVYIARQSSSFIEQERLSDLLFEECKSLCLNNVDCTALQYVPKNANELLDSFTIKSDCLIGSLNEDPMQVVADDSDKKCFVLKAKPFYYDTSYEIISGCYSGKLLDNPQYHPEKASGYVRYERTCVQSTNVSSTTGTIVTPLHCENLCSRTPECNGFIHYIDYGGTFNIHEIGSCELLYNMAKVQIGACDGVENNMDIYLRGDISMTCEASCKITKDCTSFVLDKEEGCLLYSEIALLKSNSGECIKGDYSNTTSTHQVLISINKSYRNKEDALVAVPDHCFIDIDDDAEIGCFGPSTIIDDTFFIQEDSSKMTRVLCQKKCNVNGYENYMIHNRSSCYCTDSNEFHTDFTISVNCTLECPGDKSETCGGVDSVFIGGTNVPKVNLTVSECRRKCSELPSCKAVKFYENEASTSCTMISSEAILQKCNTSGDLSSLAFVQTFERYYETPEYSYTAFEVLKNSRESNIEDCKKICDAFSRCDGIRFVNEGDVKYNCEIVGGGYANFRLSESDSELHLVRNANRFVKYPFPSDLSNSIATFEDVYHLDECHAICKAHVQCGSFIFEPKLCALFGGWTSSVMNETDKVEKKISLSSYYVDAGMFTSQVPQFTVASQGYCVNETEVATVGEMTSMSSYECAKRCLADNDCELFTFDKDIDYSCKLYDKSVSLIYATSCLVTTAKTYLLHNHEFVRVEDSCLEVEMDKDNGSKTEILNSTIIECAALCDNWFDCKSFRFHDDQDTCTLYDSYDIITPCSDDASADYSGSLFVPGFIARHELSTKKEINGPARMRRAAENECLVTEIHKRETLQSCVARCQKNEFCEDFSLTKTSECILILDRGVLCEDYKKVDSIIDLGTDAARVKGTVNIDLNFWKYTVKYYAAYNYSDIPRTSNNITKALLDTLVDYTDKSIVDDSTSDIVTRQEGLPTWDELKKPYSFSSRRSLGGQWERKTREMGPETGSLQSSIKSNAQKMENFLASDKGRSTQTLNTKAEQFKSVVDTNLQVFAKAEETFLEITNVVGEAGGLLSSLLSSTKTAETVLNAINRACIILEKIPYINVVVKALSFKSISKNAAKIFKKGNNALEKVETKFEGAMGKISSLPEHFSIVTDLMQSASVNVGSIVQLLTRVMLIVHESNGLGALFKTMKSVVDTLAFIVTSVVSFIGTLVKVLSMLGNFVNQVNGNVLQAAKKIIGNLQAIFTIVNSLKFLQTIMNFKICIPYPSSIKIELTWIRVCIKIPYLSCSWWSGCRWKYWRSCFYVPGLPKFRIVMSKACVSLNDIGGWLDDIKNIICSIPGVGFLWNKVESFVDNIIGGIFSAIGLEVPNISFSINFVDDIKNSVTGIIDDAILQTINLKDAVNINSLKTIATEKINQIKSRLNIDFGLDDLMDFFDCKNAACIYDKIKKLIGFDIDEIIEIPDSMKLAAKTIMDYTEEISNLVSECFDDLDDPVLIECASYDTVAFNVVQLFKEQFGLEDIDIPDGTFDISFEVCNDFTMSMNKTFVDRVTKIMEDIENHLDDDSITELEPSPENQPASMPNSTTECEVNTEMSEIHDCEFKIETTGGQNINTVLSRPGFQFSLPPISTLKEMLNEKIDKIAKVQATKKEFTLPKAASGKSVVVIKPSYEAGDRDPHLLFGFHNRGIDGGLKFDRAKLRIANLYNIHLEVEIGTDITSHAREKLQPILPPPPSRKLGKKPSIKPGKKPKKPSKESGKKTADDIVRDEILSIMSGRKNLRKFFNEDCMIEHIETSNKIYGLIKNEDIKSDSKNRFKSYKEFVAPKKIKQDYSKWKIAIKKKDTYNYFSNYRAPLRKLQHHRNQNQNQKKYDLMNEEKNKSTLSSNIINNIDKGIMRPLADINRLLDESEEIEVDEDEDEVNYDGDYITFEKFTLGEGRKEMDPSLRTRLRMLYTRDVTARKIFEANFNYGDNYNEIYNEQASRFWDLAKSQSCSGVEKTDDGSSQIILDELMYGYENNKFYQFLKTLWKSTIKLDNLADMLEVNIFEYGNIEGSEMGFELSKKSYLTQFAIEVSKLLRIRLLPWKLEFADTSSLIFTAATGFIQQKKLKAKDKEVRQNTANKDSSKLSISEVKKLNSKQNLKNKVGENSALQILADKGDRGIILLETHVANFRADIGEISTTLWSKPGFNVEYYEYYDSSSLGKRLECKYNDELINTRIQFLNRDDFEKTCPELETNKVKSFIAVYTGKIIFPQKDIYILYLDTKQNGIAKIWLDGIEKVPIQSTGTESDDKFIVYDASTNANPEFKIYYTNGDNSSASFQLFFFDKESETEERWKIAPADMFRRVTDDCAVFKRCAFAGGLESCWDPLSGFITTAPVCDSNNKTKTGELNDFLGTIKTN